MTVKSAPDAAVPPLILELVGRARHILILTHHNPDGDALGSARALALTLEAAGRSAVLALTGTLDQHLSFLLEGLSIVDFPNDFSAYDLVVLLDCHCLTRLERKELAVSLPDGSPPLVVIDHHPPGDRGKAEAGFYIKPAASSTGELVWHLLSALNLSPPPEAREALLTAMASDTGFFSQSNTTAAALRAVADFVEMSGGHLVETVHRRLREDVPLKRLKLMGLALDSLRLHFDGRLALMAVTPDTLKAAGAVMADTEDFVELGRSLAGVTLSALIKDNGSGRLRVSLRSREPVSASALASLFGGGGHRLAAAYDDRLAATAEEAAANLLARAENFL
ncbi:MAG: bifunctional oligoribonuclease/PAP phosphatase NrnA [Candidatus Adiutrix sp.]|jgi:phosphoesterase RecJ-like protein|nr:bifunctional oligoribonuclease/PAP phosphatase NrnA [Candidatus Adiutrix sp.]